MIFHITYYGKTGVQFASDLINHENKQIHSFEQIQEKLETNKFYRFKRGPITVDLCVEGEEPQRFTEAKGTHEDCKGWLPRYQRRNR
jgi:hypothetical protein